MKFECKYCKETLELKSSQAAGAHIINCKSNPKYDEIKTKCKDAAIKAKTVERFELTKECPSCKQNFTLFLTKARMKTKDNITYCSRACFNRRHISLETRAKLSEAAKNNIDNTKKIEGIIQSWKNKRLASQEVGRQRINAAESLYVAGCMLYWGEGNKTGTSACLVNSDPNMLILFISFLKKYWKIDDKRLAVYINCYTDLASLEEIENYWINTLQINRDNLRKPTVNNLPKSSKNKMKKSKFGTVRIQYSDTKIIQEILGAIQEYGSFTNESWANSHEQNKKIGAQCENRTHEF